MRCIGSIGNNKMETNTTDAKVDALPDTTAIEIKTMIAYHLKYELLLQEIRHDRDIWRTLCFVLTLSMLSVGLSSIMILIIGGK